MTRGTRKVHQLSNEFDTDILLVEDLLDVLDTAKTKKILGMQPKEIRQTARVNLSKTTRNQCIANLSEENIVARVISELQEGIEITQGMEKLGSSQPYLRGEVMPQGLGSMLTVEALDPQPGEVILDMAAAPGGKSCFIGERMRGHGILYANDISVQRIRSLIFNLTRHSIANALVTNVNGLDLNVKNLDRILLDSPCTGSGLIVSKPERRKSRTLHDHIILQKTQQNLLHHAMSMLDSGGILVYATCSINTMENEEVILPQLPNVEVLPLDIPGSPGVEDLDYRFKLARRLLPHPHGCDGFFIIKMVKK